MLLAELTGLSPLARGTQLVNLIRERDNRFIPAGAGNTSGRVPLPPPSSVYPRWRGEHDWIKEGRR